MTPRWHSHVGAARIVFKLVIALHWFTLSASPSFGALPHLNFTLESLLYENSCLLVSFLHHPLGCLAIIYNNSKTNTGHITSTMRDNCIMSTFTGYMAIYVYIWLYDNIYIYSFRSRIQIVTVFGTVALPLWHLADMVSQVLSTLTLCLVNVTFCPEAYSISSRVPHRCLIWKSQLTDERWHSVRRFFLW